MVMTDAEILRSFNEAKSPSKQVRILAELNLVEEDEIVQILQRQGVDHRRLPRKRKKTSEDVQSPRTKREGLAGRHAVAADDEISRQARNDIGDTQGEARSLSVSRADGSGPQQCKRKESNMAREILTDEQVEEEIARLRDSEFVRLAKREKRIRDRRRQYLYQLRSYEKKGRALAEAGITLETLNCLDEEEWGYAEA